MSEIIKIKDLENNDMCFSSNNEDYSDYIESVFEEIFELNADSIQVGDKYSFYIGQKSHPSIKEFTPDYFDLMSELAYDEYGEHAESWLNVDDKKIELISSEINDFIELLFKNHNLEPNFYKVEKVRKLDLIVFSVNGTTWDDVEFKKEPKSTT